MSDIVVVGSLNMDIINHVRRHPAVGETISAAATEHGPGGKGANQAVAAHRFGSSVAMIGAVGTDAFGSQLLEFLANEHISVERVVWKEGLSGLAFITVDDSGRNHIILSPGANGRLDMNDISPFLEELDRAQALIVQNEIPWEVTKFAIEEANKRKVKVIVNPSPIEQFSADILSKTDIIVVNQHEAEAIAGVKVDTKSQAHEAVRSIIGLGGKSVVLTLGEQGAVYLDEHGTCIEREAFQVAAVDTTAAGDTFVGALVSSLVQGKPMHEALELASAAAAVSVTRKGAIASIPGFEEVEQFVSSFTFR